MKQDTYIIEKDVLIDTVTATDNNNIHNIDPLIEAFIDTDELQKNIVNDEQLNSFEQKCASILTLNSDKQLETTTCSQIISRCTGIFYAFIASALFTCSGFIIKKLGVDFFDALLVRFILQTSIITPFIFYKKNKFINGSTNLIILQIIRAILSSSTLFLFFTSYSYIPLPDLTTCRYTQVIWTTILAMIIFRERISVPTIFAIIFTLTGVTFVAQPTFLFNNHQILSNKTNNTNYESGKSNRLIGLSLALGCALTISFSMVINKKLIISKIPQSIIIFQFSFLNLCLLIVNHIYNRFIMHKYSNQTMFTWQFFVAASVSSIQVFSSTIMQKAIKLEHPSIISVAQSSDILVAIVLQNLFSNEKSNWFVLIGSFLVTTSIFLVGINKFCQDQKKLPEKNKKTNTKL
jgi:drug/metabolite transporter (DMT)-like permease